ncbi:DUF6668 family protein [Micromonospora sp.]|uniref:DUF6668 family protein n=1 Tax=Micromonospora sp. TaxID=1876 RepID=UPI003B3AA980
MLGRKGTIVGKKAPQKRDDDAQTVTGVTSVQGSAVGFPARRGLPTAPRPWARLLVVGATGGAGESTIASLIPGARAADHRWPELATLGPKYPVLLCARTSLHGLTGAQEAAAQWAAGELPDVDLLGLVLLADAPGKLPPLLGDFIKVVAGGVPRTWSLPWVPSWRSAAPTDAAGLPRPFRRFLGEIEPLLELPDQVEHSDQPDQDDRVDHPDLLGQDEENPFLAAAIGAVANPTPHQASPSTREGAFAR